jgi:hypothetical protein
MVAVSFLIAWDADCMPRVAASNELSVISATKALREKLWSIKITANKNGATGSGSMDPLALSLHNAPAARSKVVKKH